MLGHGSTRQAIGAVLLATSLVGLSACSSSAPAVLHASPTVSANGQHYAFAGTVAPSEWPDPCDYLTVDAAGVALTSAVQVQRFGTQCLYIPENSDQPVLVVETIALGPDLGAQFDTLNSRTGGHPTDVPGVGQQASVSEPLSRRLTMNLQVRQGLFQLQLRSPAGNPVSPEKGRSILARIGRAIASEFD